MNEDHYEKAEKNSKLTIEEKLQVSGRYKALTQLHDSENDEDQDFLVQERVQLTPESLDLECKHCH